MLSAVTSPRYLARWDVSSGAFTQIGSYLPVFSDGLVPGPSGSLLTLGFDGELDAINLFEWRVHHYWRDGAGRIVPVQARHAGQPRRTLLANLEIRSTPTDFNGYLYTLNPLTGHADAGRLDWEFRPLRRTLTFPDRTALSSAFDETLFGTGGNLYATFSTPFLVDPSPFSVTVAVVAAGVISDQHNNRKGDSYRPDYPDPGRNWPWLEAQITAL